MTEITAKTLIAAGYKEYPPNSEKYRMLFQKAVCDENGEKLYFINIREWDWDNHVTFDAQLTCDTDSDGYLWATMRENSIERIEFRAGVFWQAAGHVKYDN